MSTADEATVSSCNSLGRPFRVSVEGNIGSGTAFLSYCQQQEDIGVFFEQIEAWKDVGGTNLLEKYYQEPDKWAMVVLCQFDYVKNTWSVYRHFFLRIMLENRILEPAMGTVLNEWYDLLDVQFQVKPEVIVYLETTPEVCYDRMLGRGRDEEIGVPLGYLEKLDRFHKQWLSQEQQLSREGLSDTVVLIINANLSQSDMKEQYDDCINTFRLLSLQRKPECLI